MTTHLGDYALIKEMGDAPLGTIYLAEHRFLKKAYAVNLLSPELTADSGFVSRLEKEIANLASLNHANLVKIHNVSIADGRYFVVSDCVQDDSCQDLATFLRNEKKLNEEEIFQILSQVAEALDFLHEQKMGDQPLAHRMLNLTSIWVKRDLAGLKVSLTDYGLPEIIGFDQAMNQICAKLASGFQKAFVEAYVFLAPEQKFNKFRKSHDSKGDSYAFGVLAYYLLTRDFPEGFFELPSIRNPEYKYGWDLLIYRCLQNDPLKRPASLKKALEEVQSLSGSNTLAKAQIQRWGGAGQPKAATPVQKEETLTPILRPQELIKPEFDADPGAIFQTDAAVVRYTPKQEEQGKIEPILTEMVIIPGGAYYRGSNQGGRDEIPRHKVNIRSFAIDIHPVTNEQFVKFVEALDGEKDAQNNDIIRLRESRIKKSGGKYIIETGYTKHPVVGVSWYGALAYAKWIGKRLPTEAEWEAAASGWSEECIYPTGLEIERSQANFFSSDTTPVMSYPPNEFGLYDMAGNVYDWCQDWYDYHYYDVSAQEPNDPQGPPQGVYRVLRGGCWKSLKEDLRCAHRHRNNPGTINSTYGFRCAADVG